METDQLTRRIDDLRSEMNARPAEMNTRFGSLQWKMNHTFIFLTLIMVAFKFIR